MLDVTTPATPLSFVIPLWNEEESLVELHERITRAVTPMQREWEFVFVDDGSTDGSAAVLERLYETDPRVRVIHFRGRCGKSAALMAGFRHTRFPIVVTLDADLQDEPDEIPRLVEALESGFDLVTGWKVERRDPFVKVATSRLFNVVTSAMTGIRLHDYNSGFKAYRREVFAELDLYGELHRFIPALLGLRHFRVGEIPVRHNPRKHGVTKFGPERFINGMLDLLTVMFLANYLKTPLHLFGRIGLMFLTVGMGINLFITWLKVSTNTIQGRYPLLFMGVLLTIVGIQFISTGLLAELVSKANRREADRYAIRTLRSRWRPATGFQLRRRGDEGDESPMHRESGT